MYVRVPTALLSPYIDEWVRRYEDTHHEPEGGVAQLAHMAGLHYDTVDGIRRCERKTTEFNVADRILSRINFMLWYDDDDLRAIYDTLIPRCSNPRCNKELPVPHDGGEKPQSFDDHSTEAQRWRGYLGQRLFCSEHCSKVAWYMDHDRMVKPGEEMRTFTCEFCGEQEQAPRHFGGGQAKRNRRACSKPECKRALKAALMRQHRARQRAA